jgi:RNA polymerase sigma-54 factor
MRFQREFLDHGINYLRPLVLRDVADDVGMHESTISRVTSKKYVYTPQGIFELNFFFNSGISRSDGGLVASQSVKSEVETLIKAEDPKNPLSDQAITIKLRKKGITIARRTVAKYREVMGVLSSNKRKKYY